MALVEEGGALKGTSLLLLIEELGGVIFSVHLDFTTEGILTEVSILQYIVC